MAKPMSPLRTRNEVARFSARSISRVAEARADAPFAAAFERVGSGAAQAACGEVGGGAMVGAGVGTGHGSRESGATDGAGVGAGHDSRGDSGGPGDAGASGDGGALPDHGS